MVISERIYLGDGVKYEFSYEYCREVGTLVTGQNLKESTVLGRITTTKKLTKWNPVATDGSETIAGILVGDVDATASDQPCVLISYGPAVVLLDFLILPDGVTEQQKANAKAQLWSELRIRCAEAG